jgi:hypothetical protein
MTDTSTIEATDEETSAKPLPGMFAPIDGPTDPPADISDDTKKNLKMLVAKFTGKNKTARRIEVKEARRQRAYIRGDQIIVWDSDRSCWRPFEGGTGDVEEDEGAYRHNIDVYGATARAMSAVLTQAIPGVRFEPSDPDNPADISTARAAESLRKVIERDSNVDQVLSDTDRYLWTDGRTHVFTRWTTSAAAYGYRLNEDGERVPNSRENITAYGVLEVKVPISTRDQSEYSYLNLSYEIDKTIAQTMFPDIADKITPGAEDDDYERIARQAVMSGSQLIGSTEAQDELVTYSRTWLRPSTYRALAEESDRMDLEATYPDGVLVEMVGGTFANARNENMDDHWTVVFPDSHDSQAAKSLGAMIVPIQDILNESTSIRVESFSTGASITYVDPEVVDPQVLVEEEARPNVHIPAKPKDGQSVADAFFQSASAEVPPDMVAFFDALLGPILEKVSGVTEALFGQASSDNTTASGIAQLRDNALGQLGGTYRSLRRCYTSVIYQAVRCGCKNRDTDVKTSFPGKRGKSSTIQISLQDLKGDFKCYPSSDEGFPQSWSNKRGIFLQLLGMADNPVMANILSQPKNMALGKDLLGLEDLIIEGSDIYEKVLNTIDELLADGPIPNIEVAEQYAAAKAQAIATGQPIPPQPPFQALFKCSIENDPIYDDAANEFKAVSDWINSPDGQKAKKDNPNGYANVRLYGLSQKAVMDAASAAAAPPPPPPKPPSVSLSASYKDLPASAQNQALSELGFEVGPPPPPSMAPATPPMAAPAMM